MHPWCKWPSRMTYAHLLLRELQNYNSLLNNRLLENVGSHQKKDAPCPSTKEKPQQDGRKGETAFKIKPHTGQRCSEGSYKPCAHQDPETPQRLRQSCVRVSPVEVGVSSGLPQGLGLWVRQTWVWHPLLEEVAINPIIEPPRPYTGLGA